MYTRVIPEHETILLVTKIKSLCNLEMKLKTNASIRGGNFEF
jgi:hypothetical protein